VADPLQALDGEQRALCLGARTSPTSEALERLAAVVSGGVDWERLWALAHLHEVVPLLAETLPKASGPAVPPEWLARATKRRHVTLSANARLGDVLLSVLKGMGAAGVGAMPVKGLVIAEGIYGSLAARPCADLDVLVRPGDLPTARSVLRDLGFAQRAAPGYKALVHQFHDPAWGLDTPAGQIRLELHWALWADSARRLGTDGLWERSVDSTLLDKPVRTLSAEDTLLHLSIHRTRSALRLRWVVDVAELIHRRGNTLDWSAYLDRAQGAGARTSSWVVLTLARDLLDAPVPPGVIDELAVAWPKRIVLAWTCGRPALFRTARGGDVTQQPHLALRAFEEDGPARIAAVLGGSVTRPVREALHNTGIRRVRRRMA
jgi:putative nucleotidyltransferase-like protein